jgi:tetratricopeptide (TPR) repeat protein
MLLGISLEDLHRDDEAITHYLRSADIADRSLEHSEALAAMGLRLAANLEGARGHGPTALAHLERALRLLERGRSAPDELGQTQFRIAQVTLALKDPQRARAMAEAARGSFVTAKATKELADVDAFLATNHWAVTGR